MEKVTERKNWIDALKGFVMVLVIWSHSLAYQNTIGYLFIACYMPVYFFISGYTMHTERIDLKHIILKKSKRLLIPYFAYGIVLVSLDVIFSLFQGDINYINSILKYSGLLYSRYMLYPDMTSNNIYFLKSFNSTLWFMTAMFGASILTNIYFYMKKNIRLIILIVYIVITIILSYSPILLPWSLDTIFVASIIMIVGSYYSKIEIEHKRIIKKLLIILVCTFIYFLCVKINPNINMSVRMYGPNGLLSIFLFIIIGIIGSILYVMVFKTLHCRGIIKLLIWIGRKSVTFMCIQVFILSLNSKIISKFISNNFVIGTIGILFTIIVGSILAYIFEKGSIKIKVLKYL